MSTLTPPLHNLERSHREASELQRLRRGQPGIVSRRQLLGWSIAGALGLWLGELVTGTIGFLWPNLAGGFGGVITIGKITDAENNMYVVGGPPFSSGAPAQFTDAKMFVMLVDPSTYQFKPGTSPAGDGAATNVRTLYQALHPPGLHAELLPQELLVRVPLPRIALRPARNQGRRTWTGPAQPRPILVGGEPERRADR